MNGFLTILETTFQTTWAEHIGWTLLHSLWQIALVTGTYISASFLLRGHSASTRYVTGCAALLAMLALPVITYGLLPQNASPLAVVSTPPAFLPIEQTSQEVDVANPDSSAALPFAATAASQSPEVETQIAPAAERATWASLTRAVRPYLPWATAAWMAGVSLLSLRPVWGWLHVRRLQRTGLSPLPDKVRQVAADLIERLRVNRAVRFSQSALVEVPTVVGYLRPFVLLPASAITGLSASELELILAHELAHVRRHDYVVNLAQTVAESLLFYHPGMWWVSNQIRKERENCCDDVAVALTDDRATYVRALTRLEEQRATTPATVLAATGSSLVERVRRLLGKPAADTGYRSTTTWLAGLLTVGIVVMTLAMNGTAQEGDDDLSVESAQVEERSDEADGIQCRLVAVSSESDDESPDSTNRAEKFASSDALTFAVELKNVSDQPVTLLGTQYGDSYGKAKGKLNTIRFGPHLFDFEFTDVQGKPVPRVERAFVGDFWTLNGASAHKLAPGESLTVLLRPARFMAPMDYQLPPSEYRAKVRYHGPSEAAIAKITKHWPDSAQAKAWSSEVTSNSVDFSIATDPEASEPPKLFWGPKNNGLQAAIEFRLPKEVTDRPFESPGVPIGTPVNVVFHVKNVSDRLITFARG